MERLPLTRKTEFPSAWKKQKLLADPTGTTSLHESGWPFDFMSHLYERIPFLVFVPFSCVLHLEHVTLSNSLET